MPAPSLEDVLAAVARLEARVVELEADASALGDGLGQLLQAAVQ